MARPKKIIPQFTPEPEIVEEELNDLVSDESIFTPDTEPSEPEPDFIRSDSTEDSDAEGIDDTNFDQSAIEEAPVTQPDPDWFEIETAPLVGIQVFISETGVGYGVRSYWKKTRRMENGRWKMTGKWVEPVTGAVIAFEPRYWKEIK